MSADTMTLKDVIDSVERDRMRLIETLARLIDNEKAGEEIDMEEAASIINQMAYFCEPRAALQLHTLSLFVRRIPPSQLKNFAPQVVSIIFHYDKYPLTIVDIFPEVITN